MTFTVPLGPGIVDVRVSPGDDKGRQTTFALEIEGHNTHFSESIPLVFLKRGEHFVVIRDLEVIDDCHLAGRVTLDKFVPALSWDVFVNSPVDGTMSFANGFFAQGLTASNKAKSPTTTVLAVCPKPTVSLPIPAQHHGNHPNLMLHAPMWFTMFLLMGISFAQSTVLGHPGHSRARHEGLGVGENGCGWGARAVDRSLGPNSRGARWVDDPQLNGAFVTVMVYAGYLVLRSPCKIRFGRLSGVQPVWLLFAGGASHGFASVHGEPSSRQGRNRPADDLDSALRAVFYPAVLGWMILGTGCTPRPCVLNGCAQLWPNPGCNAPRRRDFPFSC